MNRSIKTKSDEFVAHRIPGTSTFCAGDNPYCTSVLIFVKPFSSTLCYPLSPPVF